jgi:DNA-directed RNA polymerase specialized sigma24 family protein
MAAMMAQRDTMPEDCYKQTVKRLKSLPILQERIADNRARLGENGNLMPDKSKSIVRFSASGVRADPEEMLEAVVQTVKAHIAADQEEVDELMRALGSVSQDAYFPAIYDSYILKKPDMEIAEHLHCDESTVRRNRGRLTRIIAVRLYGKYAV